MVDISGRVWRYWREAHARGETESIELLFTSPLPTDDAHQELTRATNAVMREYLAQPLPPPGVDDFSPGACSLVAVPAGVVLRVTRSRKISSRC